MNIFVFDIETVPDVEGGRRLYGLDGLSDHEVGEVLFHLRRQEKDNSEFLRLHLHKIVAISVVLRSRDMFKVWSLGDVNAPEAEIIQRFFDGIEKFSPTLVSWNGGGFDLPVLHYRALLHGIAAPRYWDCGDSDREFRFNNYLSRYHNRHTDLMDVLSAFQGRAAAPLHEVATLLGLPGKLGMHGGQVWGRYLNGELQAIRDYCETDVLNTYLIYLRFELIRGHLNHDAYAHECQLARDVLTKDAKPHLQEFLQAWRIEPSKSVSPDMKSS